MIFEFSYYSVALILVSVVFCTLAWYVWKGRNLPCSRYFSLLMLMLAGQTFLTALKILVADLQVNVFLTQLSYVFLVSQAPLWLLFVVTYCRKEHLLTREGRLFLWILPAFVLFCAWTNPWLGLEWSGFIESHDPVGYLMVVVSSFGDWIMILYSYLLLVVSSLLLLWAAIKARKIDRFRYAVLFLATVIPLTTNAIYVLGLNPYTQRNLTPFAFGLTLLLYYWAIFRGHLFDPVPLAWESMVKNMANGVIVLDTGDRVLDLNPAAKALLGTDASVIGQPAAAVLKPWPGLARCCSGDAGGTSEVLVETDSRPLWIDVQFSDYTDRHGTLAGRVMILWDITRLKSAESALQQSIGALHQEVSERKLAEEKVALSLREKELLLKEIHHRVKNNLQIISSLLSLQSGTAGEETKESFRESQNRIRSMALIHEKLYQSDDLSRVDFGDYVRHLVDFLSRSYVLNPGVQIRVNISDVSLDIDTAIPCGLIINELVSNSLKHAFNGAEAGLILVSMSRSGDRYELVVSDNGVGLAPGFDFRNSATLGLQLVVTLAEQLNGALECGGENGTSFKITFRDEVSA